MVPGLPTHLGSASSLAAPLRDPRIQILLLPVTLALEVAMRPSLLIRTIPLQIQIRVTLPQMMIVINHLVAAAAVHNLQLLATARLPVHRVDGTV